MGKDERIVLWDNSSGELIPKPSVSISSLPNNSWQIAFNFHFLTKQHQGKQATKSNVCPVICHPNILYILIQFKSFYRFAQGYCGWLKVESREKLLDVGTHKICTHICMRCITINLPRSNRWEGYWPLRDITQRCCHGYAQQPSNCTMMQLSLSPNAFRCLRVEINNRETHLFNPLYLPLRSQRCEWAINLIFLVRTWKHSSNKDSTLLQAIV